MVCDASIFAVCYASYRQQNIYKKLSYTYLPTKMTLPWSQRKIKIYPKKYFEKTGKKKTIFLLDKKIKIYPMNCIYSYILYKYWTKYWYKKDKKTVRSIFSKNN